MKTSTRTLAEQEFHDRQAAERADALGPDPRALVFTDDAYLDHETWIRPAFALLGDIRNLRVLDFGCGHGMAAVVLARHGGCVTGFDLSSGYIHEAKDRAYANGVGIDFVQADGERLPFASETFDRIWGNAVLHHLDLHVAGSELFRVLKPGGHAVFCEPWGENRLLQWARRRLPYPGKARTAAEEPLRRADVNALAKFFPNIEIQGFQLMSMARRVLLKGRIVHRLDHWDSMLLERIPALQNYCRYVVLALRRPQI